MFLFLFISCSEKKTRGNWIREKKVLKEKYFAEQEKKTALLKDSISVHTLQKGETLWDLCRGYYGNRHYSALVMIYNQIANEKELKEGLTLEIPLLADLLKAPKLGLYPTIWEEISKIVEARKLFMKHEKTLLKLQKATRKNKQKAELSTQTVNDIRKAATLIEEVQVALKIRIFDGKKSPKKMIANLRNVSQNLKNLLEGNLNDNYSYDLDMVHQDLIRAFKNGIAWSGQ